MPDERAQSRGPGAPPSLPQSVRRIVVGDLETNCYMLVCPHSGDAVLVDPGDDGGRLLRVVGGSGAALKLVLLTHGHADHFGGLPEILSAYPDCAVGASAVALGWLGDPALNLSHWVGTGLSVRPANVISVVDGQTVQIGRLRLRAIAVPGHTPGCLAYLGGDADGQGGSVAGDPVLFSGDVLFRGAAGRVDLPGGSWRQMAQSLRLLAALPPATVVLPGHGAATTIGAERDTNGLIRQALAEKAGDAGRPV